MRPIETILACTDFTEESDRALAAAEWIARIRGAELVLAHVVEPLDYAYGDRMTAVVAQHSADAQRDLGRAAEAMRARGVTARAQVRTGSIVEQLLEEMKQLQPQLVVVGRHGRTGFEVATLGSVAEQLVYKAPCDVLVVAAPIGPADLHVAAATDFSPASRAGVDRALELVRNTERDHLHLVHSFRLPLGWSKLGEEPEAMFEEIRLYHEAELQRFLDETENAGVEIRTAVRRGEPEQVLADLQDEIGINLVFCGARGRTAAASLVLGRTTRHIVHRVPVSVWVARPEGERVSLLAALKRLLEP